jgi:hypothetical protein
MRKGVLPGVQSSEMPEMRVAIARLMEAMLAGDTSEHGSTISFNPRIIAFSIQREYRARFQATLR